MNEDMNTPNVRCLQLPSFAFLWSMTDGSVVVQVRRAHFVQAAKSVRRRITPEVIQEYEEWRDRSGVRSA